MKPLLEEIQGGTLAEAILRVPRCLAAMFQLTAKAVTTRTKEHRDVPEQVKVGIV